MFWKAVPKENWPQDDDYLASIKENWVEPFGDMRQELVFIGQDVDQEAVTSELNNCLLSESEVLKGEAYWKTLNDPFPAWT
jgi:G3E family GTPase